jgi:predicted RecB family nuclease
MITSSLIEAYTQCQLKAFLLLQGKIEGKAHEYSKILKDRSTANRRRLEVTPDSVKRGLIEKIGESWIIKHSDMAADCDVIFEKTASHPQSKSSHLYEPGIAVGTYSITKEQRLILAFSGFVASEKTKSKIINGIIVTQDYKRHRINLKEIYPIIMSTIDGLRGMINNNNLEKPILCLNKHCPTCPFTDHCRKEAEESDNLSLLQRMTPKIIKRYERKGIFTIKQLSYVFNPRKRRKKSIVANSIFNIELQALSLRTRKIYLHETPSIQTHTVEIFLDIEGVPDENYYYLIGLMINTPEGIKRHSFWADTRLDEKAIFKAFIDVAESYEGAPIYHYGNYDSKALINSAKRYELEAGVIEKRLINVNTLIYGKVYFPTTSNRLKDIGAFIGAEWDSPEASGLQSLVWRYCWENQHDDQLKIKLQRYNQDDCQALYRLMEELKNIGKVALTSNDIEFSLRPKQVSSEYGTIIHTELKHIIVSAHEEQYDKKRLKIKRTPGQIEDHKQPTPRQSPVLARKIQTRGGTRICVPAQLHCLHKDRSALIVSDVTTEHAIIELFFTKSGCKKIIVRYFGKIAICPTCRAKYMPPILQRIQPQIFGHQFQSWAVNQRIALRMPYSAIAKESEDIFNEPLNKASINGFVQQFSKIYEPTKNYLLQCILKSPFVHADETKINIGGVSQFAWALTDGRHAVFWLTKTRETTVLQDMLKDYKGVLISDFYAGYDAFSCRQQKCIVHLLRDINDDLWKNPFNKEFEDFVGKVRDLFVPIFDDVYKYGLKKYHLGKHLKSVDTFYKRTVANGSKCELISTYCKRFERYRKSLFVFLEIDGIPWNNNMAERAIRHLAIQRKISGSFSKTGAEHYLLLLSISQSCRFQNKSFLRFLLSGEMDVDIFNERLHLPRNGKLIIVANIGNDALNSQELGGNYSSINI